MEDRQFKYIIIFVFPWALKESQALGSLPMSNLLQNEQPNLPVIGHPYFVSWKWNVYLKPDSRLT